MTALGGVVFTTALTGMAIAVALSLLAILYQASRPYIAVLGRMPGRPTGVRRRGPPPEGRAGRRASSAPARTSRSRSSTPMSRRTRSWPSSRRSPRRPASLVLDIGATADLDVATTDMLAALHADLREAGIELRLVAGPRFRPRSDAPDRADGDDRRRPLLPVRRGGVAVPLPTQPATPAADGAVVADEPPPDAPLA